MGCITWQRVALRTADFLISAVVVLFLLTAGAYSAYALWDNNQVYAAVDNGGVGDGMLMHFDNLEKHAAAGAAIAAIVLFGWAMFCLFKGFGRDLGNDDPRDR